jgi:hypothetical protein
MNEERLARLRAAAGEDKTLSGLIANIQSRADSLFGEPPVPFRITGPRMLRNCQEILDRVTTLLFAWRFTGIKTYRLRALIELRSAAGFPHWNPDHFLDTAELCTAFGIAYDWLRPSTSGDEMDFVRDALVEKGLRAGLKAYAEKAWWLEHRFNWNNVCHGGLAIGALAVADEEPEIAERLLSTAVEKLPLSMANFEPDGAWQAGPDYWEYTARYTALFIDALQTALGRDFHLKTPGLGKTGWFPVHCAGPADLYFNFADAAPESGAKASLFWLGGQFGIAGLIRETHRQLEKHLSAGEPIDPFHAVWYRPDMASVPLPPEGAAFSGPETVFIRSGWNDPASTFVGFKGGTNRADHGHLDLGSFVLDMLGERWAFDLGRDDYDLPGYWETAEGGGRWEYFRLNNFSHNTLTLNGDLQRADAAAPVLWRRFSKMRSFAVADLSAAYVPHARSVLRGVALLDGGTFLVQDEIEWNGHRGSAVWNLMTDAAVDPSGGAARLAKAGQTIHCRILSPETASFGVSSARREPPEAANEGFQQLRIECRAGRGKTVIAVLISARPDPKTEVIPLREWQ